MTHAKEVLKTVHAIETVVQEQGGPTWRTHVSLHSTQQEQLRYLQYCQARGATAEEGGEGHLVEQVGKKEAQALVVPSEREGVFRSSPPRPPPPAPEAEEKNAEVVLHGRRKTNDRRRGGEDREVRYPHEDVAPAARIPLSFHWTPPPPSSSSLSSLATSVSLSPLPRPPPHARRAIPLLPPLPSEPQHHVHHFTKAALQCVPSIRMTMEEEDDQKEHPRHAPPSASSPSPAIATTAPRGIPEEGTAVEKGGEPQRSEMVPPSPAAATVPVTPPPTSKRGEAKGKRKLTPSTMSSVFPPMPIAQASLSPSSSSAAAAAPLSLLPPPTSSKTTTPSRPSARHPLSLPLSPPSLPFATTTAASLSSSWAKAQQVIAQWRRAIQDERCSGAIGIHLILQLYTHVLQSHPLQRPFLSDGYDRLVILTTRAVLACVLIEKVLASLPRHEEALLPFVTVLFSHLFVPDTEEMRTVLGGSVRFPAVQDGLMQLGRSFPDLPSTMPPPHDTTTTTNTIGIARGSSSVMPPLPPPTEVLLPWEEKEWNAIPGSPPPLEEAVAGCGETSARRAPQTSPEECIRNEEVENPIEEGEVPPHSIVSTISNARRVTRSAGHPLPGLTIPAPLFHGGEEGDDDEVVEEEPQEMSSLHAASPLMLDVTKRDGNRCVGAFSPSNLAADDPHSPSPAALPCNDFPSITPLSLHSFHVPPLSLLSHAGGGEGAWERPLSSHHHDGATAWDSSPTSMHSPPPPRRSTFYSPPAAVAGNAGVIALLPLVAVQRMRSTSTEEVDHGSGGGGGGAGVGSTGSRSRWYPSSPFSSSRQPGSPLSGGRGGPEGSGVAPSSSPLPPPPSLLAGAGTAIAAVPESRRGGGGGGSKGRDDGIRSKEALGVDNGSDTLPIPAAMQRTQFMEDVQLHTAPLYALANPILLPITTTTTTTTSRSPTTTSAMRSPCALLPPCCQSRSGVGGVVGSGEKTARCHLPTSPSTLPMTVAATTPSTAFWWKRLIDPFCRMPFLIAHIEVSRKAVLLAHQVRSRQLHFHQLPRIFTMTYLKWSQVLLRTTLRVWFHLCMERRAQEQKLRLRWAKRRQLECIRTGVMLWRGYASAAILRAEQDQAVKEEIRIQKEALSSVEKEVKLLKDEAAALHVEAEAKRAEQIETEEAATRDRREYERYIHRVREMDRVGTLLLKGLLLQEDPPQLLPPREEQQWHLQTEAWERKKRKADATTTENDGGEHGKKSKKKEEGENNTAMEPVFAEKAATSTTTSAVAPPSPAMPTSVVQMLDPETSWTTLEAGAGEVQDEWWSWWITHGEAEEEVGGGGGGEEDERKKKKKKRKSRWRKRKQERRRRKKWKRKPRQAPPAILAVIPSPPPVEGILRTEHMEKKWVLSSPQAVAKQGRRSLTPPLRSSLLSSEARPTRAKEDGEEEEASDTTTADNAGGAEEEEEQEEVVEEEEEDVEEEKWEWEVVEDEVNDGSKQGDAEEKSLFYQGYSEERSTTVEEEDGGARGGGRRRNSVRGPSSATAALVLQRREASCSPRSAAGGKGDPWPPLGGGTSLVPGGVGYTFSDYYYVSAASSLLSPPFPPPPPPPPGILLRMALRLPPQRKEDFRRRQVARQQDQRIVAWRVMVEWANQRARQEMIAVVKKERERERQHLLLSTSSHQKKRRGGGGGGSQQEAEEEEEGDGEGKKAAWTPRSRRGTFAPSPPLMENSVEEHTTTKPTQDTSHEQEEGEEAEEEEEEEAIDAAATTSFSSFSSSSSPMFVSPSPFLSLRSISFDPLLSSSPLVMFPLYYFLLLMRSFAPEDLHVPSVELIRLVKEEDDVVRDAIEKLLRERGEAALMMMGGGGRPGSLEVGGGEVEGSHGKENIPSPPLLRSPMAISTSPVVPGTGGGVGYSSFSSPTIGGGYPFSPSGGSGDNPSSTTTTPPPWYATSTSSVQNSSDVLSLPSSPSARNMKMDLMHPMQPLHFLNSRNGNSGTVSPMLSMSVFPRGPGGGRGPHLSYMSGSGSSPSYLVGGSMSTIADYKMVEDIFLVLPSWILVKVREIAKILHTSYERLTGGSPCVVSLEQLQTRQTRYYILFLSSLLRHYTNWIVRRLTRDNDTSSAITEGKKGSSRRSKAYGGGHTTRSRRKAPPPQGAVAGATEGGEEDGAVEGEDEDEDSDTAPLGGSSSVLSSTSTMLLQSTSMTSIASTTTSPAPETGPPSPTTTTSHRLHDSKTRTGGAGAGGGEDGSGGKRHVKYLDLYWPPNNHTRWYHFIQRQQRWIAVSMSAVHLALHLNMTPRDEPTIAQQERISFFLRALPMPLLEDLLPSSSYTFVDRMECFIQWMQIIERLFLRLTFSFRAYAVPLEAIQQWMQRHLDDNGGIQKGSPHAGDPGRASPGSSTNLGGAGGGGAHATPTSLSTVATITGTAATATGGAGSFRPSQRKRGKGHHPSSSSKAADSSPLPASFSSPAHSPISSLSTLEKRSDASWKKKATLLKRNHLFLARIGALDDVLFDDEEEEDDDDDEEEEEEEEEEGTMTTTMSNTTTAEMEKVENRLADREKSVSRLSSMSSVSASSRQRDRTPGKASRQSSSSHSKSFQRKGTAESSGHKRRSGSSPSSSRQTSMVLSERANETSKHFIAGSQVSTVKKKRSKGKKGKPRGKKGKRIASFQKKKEGDGPPPSPLASVQEEEEEDDDDDEEGSLPSHSSTSEQISNSTTSAFGSSTGKKSKQTKKSVQDGEEVSKRKGTKAKPKSQKKKLQQPLQKKSASMSSNSKMEVEANDDEEDEEEEDTPEDEENNEVEKEEREGMATTSSQRTMGSQRQPTPQKTGQEKKKSTTTTTTKHKHPRGEDSFGRETGSRTDTTAHRSPPSSTPPSARSSAKPHPHGHKTKKTKKRKKTSASTTATGAGSLPVDALFFITANQFWRLLVDAGVAGDASSPFEWTPTLHRAAVWGIVEHVVFRTLRRPGVAATAVHQGMSSTSPTTMGTPGVSGGSYGALFSMRGGGGGGRSLAPTAPGGGSGGAGEATSTTTERWPSAPPSGAPVPLRDVRVVGCIRQHPHFARAIQESRHVDLRLHRGTIAMNLPQFLEALVRCAHYWQCLRTAMGMHVPTPETAEWKRRTQQLLQGENSLRSSGAGGGAVTTMLSSSSSHRPSILCSPGHPRSGSRSVTTSSASSSVVSTLNNSVKRREGKPSPSAPGGGGLPVGAATNSARSNSFWGGEKAPAWVGGGHPTPAPVARSSWSARRGSNAEPSTLPQRGPSLPLLADTTNSTTGGAGGWSATTTTHPNRSFSLLRSPPPSRGYMGGGGGGGANASTTTLPSTVSGGTTTTATGGGSGAIQYEPSTLEICTHASLYPAVLEDFLENWVLPKTIHPLQLFSTSFSSMSSTPLRRAMRDRRVRHFLTVWQDALFTLFSTYTTPKEAIGIRRALPSPFAQHFANQLSSLPPLTSLASASSAASEDPNGNRGRRGSLRRSSFQGKNGGGGGGSSGMSVVLSSTTTPPPPAAAVGPRDVGIVGVLTLKGALNMAKELNWTVLTTVTSLASSPTRRTSPRHARSPSVTSTTSTPNTMTVETITHCFQHCVADRRREANGEVMFFSEFPLFLCSLSYYYHVDPTETLFEKISAFLLEKVITE